MTNVASRKIALKGLLGLMAFTTVNVTAAQAVTYSLFDSFNGTAAGAPGSGYAFGYTSAGAFGGTLTPFDADCSVTSTVCAGATGIDALAVAKATINGGSYDIPGSGFYDAGELNFHPGPIGQNSGFQFTAATPGSYAYDIGLSVNDTATAFHSVDYRLFQGTTLLASGILQDGLAASLVGSADTSNGSVFTFLIGSNGDYRYDSTGVRGTFSTEPLPTVNGAVPEPASWAMMIVGFGAVGGAMRRRDRTSVRFT